MCEAGILRAEADPGEIDEMQATSFVYQLNQQSRPDLMLAPLPRSVLLVVL